MNAYDEFKKTFDKASGISNLHAVTCSIITLAQAIVYLADTMREEISKV